MPPQRWVTLSVTSIPVPMSNDGAHPPDTVIAAIGMLLAITLDDRKWYFLSLAAAICAGDSEDRLLDWLAEHVPYRARLVGWHVDGVVIPALIDAASTASPDVAARSMAKLAECLKGGVTDIAMRFGGAAARDLADVAADHCVALSLATAGERFSAWSFGDIDQLERIAAEDALGLWRLFLRISGDAGLEAETATLEWLADRDPTSGVLRGNDTHWLRHAGAAAAVMKKNLNQEEGDDQ